MSRTLIISDVHANFEALSAVLNHAYDLFDYDEVWFLGDMFGYGPQPYQVWRMLCGDPATPTLCLAGNHDWGVLERIKNSGFMETDPGNGNMVHVGHYRKEAYAVIQEHKISLNAYGSQVISSVKKFPVMAMPRQGVFLTHGVFSENLFDSLKHYCYAPPAPSEMVAGFQNAYTKYHRRVFCFKSHDSEKITSPKFFACGHSHKQFIMRWNSSTWEKLPLGKEFYTLGDLESSPILINPGSVGFPRDANPCPGYALVDWEQGLLYFRRVPYDVSKVRQDMSFRPYSDLLNESGFLRDPLC